MNVIMPRNIPISLYCKYVCHKANKLIVMYRSLKLVCMSFSGYGTIGYLVNQYGGGLGYVDFCFVLLYLLLFSLVCPLACLLFFV